MFKQRGGGGGGKRNMCVFTSFQHAQESETYSHLVAMKEEQKALNESHLSDTYLVKLIILKKELSYRLP